MNLKQKNTVHNWSSSLMFPSPSSAVPQVLIDIFSSLRYGFPDTASQTMRVSSAIWKLSVLTRHVEMCLFLTEMEFSLCIVLYDQKILFFGKRLNVHCVSMFPLQTVKQRKSMSILKAMACVCARGFELNIWLQTFSAPHSLWRRKITERETNSTFATLSSLGHGFKSSSSQCKGEFSVW